MLWFKFSFGAKFLKLVQFLFLLSRIHYHNLEQWQIKLKPVQKNIKPRINLNHNIYIYIYGGNQMRPYTTVNIMES